MTDSADAREDRAREQGPDGEQRDETESHGRLIPRTAAGRKSQVIVQGRFALRTQ
jgi:hypothetical protein